MRFRQPALACLAVLFYTGTAPAAGPDRGNGDLIWAVAIFGIVQFAIILALANSMIKRRHAEQDAAQARERLAHCDRIHAMGEMATGIAHEINQPLAAIVSYATAGRKIMESGQPDLAELDRALAGIGTAASKAGEVLRELRAMLRKREPRRVPADLNGLVREALVLAEASSHESGIRIEKKLADHLPQAAVDPVQIQQVILNLVQNGIEATRSHGATGLVIRTAATDDDRLELSVRDSGPGISDEHAARLFEPFFTTKKDGMGLGLTISRSIIEAHEGRLWFTPNPDGGVTFRFTLPVATDLDFELADLPD
jgi:C4-dicarboxylate-specific signal transduction histidine kinase